MHYRLSLRKQISFQSSMLLTFIIKEETQFYFKYKYFFSGSFKIWYFFLYYFIYLFKFIYLKKSKIISFKISFKKCNLKYNKKL